MAGTEADKSSGSVERVSYDFWLTMRRLHGLGGSPEQDFALFLACRDAVRGIKPDTSNIK